MKLHRNIALGIIAGLESSLFEKRPATEVIKKLLKSKLYGTLKLVGEQIRYGDLLVKTI